MLQIVSETEEQVEKLTGEICAKRSISKLEKVARELLTTERAYVRKLNLVDQVCWESNFCFGRHATYHTHIELEVNFGASRAGNCVLSVLWFQTFHFRIVRENRAHHMFPDEVIPQMFSNIKSIYLFHKEFLLLKLEERMAEWWVVPWISSRH